MVITLLKKKGKEIFVLALLEKKSDSFIAARVLGKTAAVSSANFGLFSGTKFYGKYPSFYSSCVRFAIVI